MMIVPKHSIEGSQQRTQGDFLAFLRPLILMKTLLAYSLMYQNLFVCRSALARTNTTRV